MDVGLMFWEGVMVVDERVDGSPWISWEDGIGLLAHSRSHLEGRKKKTAAELFDDFIRLEPGE